MHFLEVPRTPGTVSQQCQASPPPSLLLVSPTAAPLLLPGAGRSFFCRMDHAACVRLPALAIILAMSASFWPALSLTTKHPSNSSTDQGGGKRRGEDAPGRVQ